MWQRVPNWSTSSNWNRFESNYNDISNASSTFPSPLSRESFQYIPGDSTLPENAPGRQERFRININTEGFEPHEIDVRVENRKIHIKACREETIRSCQSTKKIERTYDIPMDADVHGMSLSFPDKNSMIIEFPVLPFSFNRSKYYNQPRITRQETTQEVTRVIGSSDSKTYKSNDSYESSKTPQTPLRNEVTNNPEYMRESTSGIMRQSSSNYSYLPTSVKRSSLSRNITKTDSEGPNLNDGFNSMQNRAFSTDQISSDSRIVRATKVPIIDDRYQPRTRTRCASDVVGHYQSFERMRSYSPTRASTSTVVTPMKNEMSEFCYDTFYRSSFSPKIIRDTITGAHKLVMNLDVDGYDPGDIKVSVQGNDLRVEGEHFLNDNGKTSRKYFLKEVALPPEAIKTEVKSVLINKSRLQIEAPISELHT